MDFTLFFMFVGSIICSKDESIKIFKEIDKSSLDLQLIENETDVIISIKSQEFLPLFGNWYAQDSFIVFGNFRIGGDDIFNWIRKNIVDKKSLDDFLSTFGNTAFVLKTEKRHLEGNNSNFETRLELIKRSDVEIFLNEYLNKLPPFNSSGRILRHQKIITLTQNFVRHQITCSLMYENNSGQMPDFNKYEFVVYKSYKNASKKKIISETKFDSFKRTLIDVGQHTIVGLAIFAPFALIIHVILAKFIIKK